MSHPLLAPRQSPTPDGSGIETGNGDTDEFLKLISDPFSSQLSSTSFIASLVWTLAGSAALLLVFCFLRPRTNAVYAPRAKHADEKHAPPRLDNGFFSWIDPIMHMKEPELVEKVGLDAGIFLRFIKMCRDIFIAFTVVGLAILLPVNLGGTHTTGPDYKKTSIFMKFTPQFSSGSKFWAYTVCAYLLNGIVCGLLWWNYRAVVRLRRNYFNSPEYKSSLHSRTLMISHIPSSYRTDDGIVRLAEEAKATEDVPKGAIARNVRDLPDLLEDHEEAVKDLEKVLAKYFRNPNSLPINRPTCKPSKKDKARDHGRDVDAIDYHTERIRHLEHEIRQVRETVDQRNPMPFGFASYTHIEDAHAVAYASKQKGPQGTDIRLAPKPNDLIWKNLAMTRQTRRTKSFWNGLWMTVLTILFIVPNILTAVFLSNLANLGLVWKGFQQNLEGHTTIWGIVQGIVAPAFQTLFYVVLPIIFRRMFQNAGDTTKTSRERHVASRLFSFFIFNRLIVFSVFAAIWRFIAALASASKSVNGVTWQTIKDTHPFQSVVIGLIDASPFWITNQLQNNLGVAVDIVQVLPLFWGSFMRRYGSPTPRQTIELSAPQPIEYAAYYNSYLFAATVGFCFAVIQPLILPVTALYLAIEGWSKKYLVLYVLITKTESGGVFWRVLVNRLLIGLFLGDLVIALVIGALGVGESGPTSLAAIQVYALVPLPFLLIGFKYYCRRAFDEKIGFYSTQAYSQLAAQAETELSSKKRNDRVGVRFGNPALYRKLITPMVSAKAQHLLKDVYTGRLNDQEMEGFKAGQGVYGYSDVYMSQMSHDQPGKPAAKVGVEQSNAPFEIVPESQMDFEYFKRRQEFRDEFGGEGQLYGRDTDQYSRPGSRGSMSTLGFMGQAHERKGSGSPAGSRASSRTRVHDPYGDEAGTVYPKGYHTADSPRGESPSRAGRAGSVDITASGHPAFRDEAYDDRGRLMSYAAGMGQRRDSGSPAPTPGYQPYRYQAAGHGRDSPGSRPETPGSSGMVGIDDTPGIEEDTSYDYFRRGRRY